MRGKVGLSMEHLKADIFTITKFLFQDRRMKL